MSEIPEFLEKKMQVNIQKKEEIKNTVTLSLERYTDLVIKEAFLDKYMEGKVFNIYAAHPVTEKLKNG